MEARSTTATTQQYECLSTVYDQRWAHYTRRTVGEMVGRLRLRGTERLLDVGCGTGELIRLAHERFPRLVLTAVDVTWGMVAVAHEKLRNVPSASFSLARAEGLPFVAESFDVVTCGNMLHHVRDAASLLQECARVLRPAGQLLLLDWCRDFWHCAWFHYWLRVTDPTPMSGCTACASSQRCSEISDSPR